MNLCARSTLGFAASAQVQEDVDQPGVSILDFDVTTIGPILTEMNILWQTRQSPDGRPFILANADGQTVFVLSPLACRDEETFSGCVGLQYISVFDGEAQTQSVRDFNNRYAFANVGVNALGNSYMSRYDIADYGMARGNFAITVSTFSKLAQIYLDASGASATQVSIDDDVAGGVTLNDASPNAAHLELLSKHAPHAEQARENLITIMQDTALPTNKIRNFN